MIWQKIRLALCLVLLFVTAAVATVAAFAQEAPTCGCLPQAAFCNRYAAR